MSRREKLLMFGVSWMIVWFALSAVTFLLGISPSVPTEFTSFMGCCTGITLRWLLEKP